MKKLIQGSTIERRFERSNASTKGNALRDYPTLCDKTLIII